MSRNYTYLQGGDLIHKMYVRRKLIRGSFLDPQVEIKCERRKTALMSSKRKKMEQNVNEIKMSEFGKNLPEKKFVAGAVSATIWRNEQVKNNEEISFNTISLQRRYTDKEGNWKTSNNLRVNDVPKAILVLQKAYEYITLKTGTDE